MRWSEVFSSLRLSDRGFTDRAVQAVAIASREAADRGYRSVTPAHVLLGLTRVERGPGRLALERLGLDLGRHLEAITALAAVGEPGESGDRPDYGPDMERVLAEAQAQAQALGHDYVGTEHLVLALVTAGGDPVADFFRERGIAAGPVRRAVAEVLTGP